MPTWKIQWKTGLDAVNLETHNVIVDEEQALAYLVGTLPLVQVKIDANNTIKTYGDIVVTIQQ